MTQMIQYADLFEFTAFLLALFAAGQALELIVFFFNETATTEIYTLSLHDALPITPSGIPKTIANSIAIPPSFIETGRSEEHTSELQSHSDLVCRLLLEKKKRK